MTSTVGEELMAAMAELRRLFPDWRMGQMVANLAQPAELSGKGPSGTRRTSSCSSPPAGWSIGIKIVR